MNGLMELVYIDRLEPVNDRGEAEEESCKERRLPDVMTGNCAKEDDFLDTEVEVAIRRRRLIRVPCARERMRDSQRGGLLCCFVSTSELS